MADGGLRVTTMRTVAAWMIGMAAAAGVVVGAGLTGAGAATSAPATSAPATSAPATSGSASAFRLVASDGGVFAYGGAGFDGSMGGHALVGPVVGTAPTTDGGGYWLTATDGGVFAFGDAAFHGSMGGRPLVAPVVGMAPTPDGGGYWLGAADGGIFAFGDAPFYGSMGGRPLVAPIVGTAATPGAGAGGYWLVAADGGVFAFGDAPFYGSMGGRLLAAPIVGMAPTPDGGGYWLVAADGGVFAFGDAPFLGSLGGQALSAPIVGMAATPGGLGYWLVGADGAVHPLGAAGSSGDATTVWGGSPVVAIAGAGGAPQPVSVLHEFGNGPGDGWQPWGSPTYYDGTLFGYTAYGGADGVGAIWTMNPAVPSSYRLVHTFGGIVTYAAAAGGGQQADGADPHHDWLRPSPVGLIGATVFGGNDDKGSVYSYDPTTGAYTVLHSFTGSKTDGAEEHSNPNPELDPVSGSQVLVGLTAAGGASKEGTLYEMNFDGSGFDVLHSFADATGSVPHGFVVEQGDLLFGMTRQGGFVPKEKDFTSKSDFDNYKDGDGVIFSYDVVTGVYSVLHGFGYTGPLGDDTSDGAATDHGGLALAGDRLYGMTTFGGTDEGGVLFSIGTDGSDYEVLHTFGPTSAGGDLSEPHGTPIVGPGGSLFGLASDGGTDGAGGVFEYLPGPGPGPGVYRLLSDFPGPPGAQDGLDDPVVVPQAGGGVTLYGQTKFGGVDSTYTPAPTAPDYGGNSPDQANGVIWSLPVSR